MNISKIANSINLSIDQMIAIDRKMKGIITLPVSHNFILIHLNYENRSSFTYR